MAAKWTRFWVLALGMAAFSFASIAEEEDAAATSTAAKIDALEQELDQLREEVEAVRQERGSRQSPSLSWEYGDSLYHLAGYAAASFTDVDNQNESFGHVSFNPIFHYQYQDKVLLEAELEIEIEEDGETEVALEYLTIDWMFHNNATLIVGKFLSPLGFFRQNLHPAWVNRLASAPPGFGHDGAAPLAEVGVQIRGGFTGGGQSRYNYSAYIGNGPELEAEGGELHGVESEGFGRDADGEMIFGGRFGFLPIKGLEIGVSAAMGDVAVVIDDDIEITGDPNRSYEVVGLDFFYRITNAFSLRAEFISQDVGEAVGSVAPEKAKWETWYAQGGYEFGGGNWEAVLRYTEFDSPHADDDQEQVAVGINYWFAPSAAAKFTYESNDGLPGSMADEDRILLQLAYGF